MVGCAVARASWGFWAVVWKPNARRPGTRVAPGPGPSSGRPCYSGSRCFMGISFGLVLVEGLPAAGWATWVDVRSVRGTRGRGKRLGRRLDGRRGARRPRPPKKNLCRAAPRAGPGRFHCRVRELWSRRPFGRMFNGPGGSDPSPMFVAATVRLLLPPATDTKSLRRPRHIQIPAVPFPRGEDHGRWMAFGRPQRRPRTRRIRVPLIGCDSW